MDFESEFQARYGFPIEHTKLSANLWNISKWSNDSWSTFAKSDNIKNNILDVMEKQFSELSLDILNGKTTTEKPIQVSNNFTYQNKFNIHVNTGLAESAKRDTGETSTTIDWIGVGTDGTAESVSQTGLGSAYGNRKQFSVDGQRKAVNQTAKYGMLFDDSDLTVPITLREACTFTASTSGICHHRISYSDFVLDTGERIVFSIYELMQNG